MSFYPIFSFEGFSDYVEVLNTLDGDTICVIVPISLEFGNGKNKKFGLYRLNIRLLGIDTCELKSKSELAFKAKDRLISLIDECEKKIFLKLYNYDKYGRILGELFKDSTCDVSFNQILLNEGLAKPYFGGKKTTT